MTFRLHRSCRSCRDEPIGGRLDRPTARTDGSRQVVIAQAVMSFVVNRAQAAEPNTAVYSAWRPRFLTISSQ
ncbi:hypothetical protein GA0115235_12334 [Streptomyces sp. DpondAA-F4a]|nr:hypothetical protein GA0115235_12334 [Streptomyces sp. DpondAA-F4a]